jgi:uncharacterized RDD family membrane protein YckC
MHTARRTLERLWILLACVYVAWLVAWLVFIDPTYLALNDDELLLTAALTVSIVATLLSAACTIYSTWTK